MKKFIYTIIAVLGILMPASLWAQNPYAVLSEDSTVVTFYYDDQKAARGGIDINTSYIKWDKKSPYGSATTAVFDNSFANYFPTSTAHWFEKCSSLVTISGIQNMKTDNVTNMSYMFSGCSGLTSLDVSGFKTDNVTSMSGMFRDCIGLTSLDLSGFKTDNVKRMSGMFSGCSGLTSLDVSGFKTDNVTDMSYMFSGCSGLTSLDVSGFKTDNVTSMSVMFNGCIGLTSLDVSGFKTDNVTDMSWMFYRCCGLTSLDLSGFKTDNVTYMEYMFVECIGLTSLDLSGFKTDNVTSMSYMFSCCSGLTSLDVSGFKTDNVTSMSGMFVDCSGLTSLDVSGFKTDNVERMSGMFYGCSGLTSLDLSGFKTDSVITMEEMFKGCSELTTIYVTTDWNTKKIISSNDMFSGCTNLIGGAGTKYDPEHTNHTYAHIDGGKTNPGYFTDINRIGVIATFDGLTAYVSGGAELDEAFEEVGGRAEAAKTIAAIVWENDNAITSEMLQGFDNPNLLIYVANDTLAPAGVKNLVVDGVCKNIVLTDVTSGNNNFFAPREFNVESISYTREFKQATEKDVSRGWEGIALPFTVQTITHSERGAIAPFDNAKSNYHFWLHEATEQGAIDATEIEANKAYIISMPNSELYPEVYCLNGSVTFSAENALVPVTEVKPVTLSDGITMTPAFQSVAKTDDVYALNVGESYESYPEGSVFVKNYKEIRPFEVYTQHSNPSSARIITISSLIGGNGTTGIESFQNRTESGTTNIYDLQGRKVKATATTLESLPKGIYIINNKKVVVR